MRFHLSACLILGLTASSFAGAAPDVQKLAENHVATPTYTRLPLIFEANHGQLPADDSFISRGPGYSLLFARNRISLTLQSAGAKKKTPLRRDIIDLGIVGAAAECKLQGVDDLPGKTNYFIGSDPTKWRVGVPTFGKIRYENVYSGIDLVFYGNGRELEYDFVVHPGVDPNQIEFSIKGETSANLEESGGLALATHAGTIHFRAPVIYQQDGDLRHNIDGHFKLVGAQHGEKKLSFVLDPYDHSRTLVIDPVLDYSTYLGGSADDWAGGVAVDNAGNAYLTGTTASLNFPVTPSAVFPAHDTCTSYCYDAFVAKISTTGEGLEYATYLGGSGTDYGNAIAVDASGNAYIAGTTNSTDFPTTDNALQRSCGGSCSYDDAFVVKLNSSGSALLYSTYLGGSAEDSGTGIALLGNAAYVSGFSGSTDFPIIAGAYQSSMQGQGSSFVAQLNATATALTFSTFLGEVDLFDAGGTIAVDAVGNSYVAGTTLSTTFPQTPGAFHTPFLSGLSSNMYILKLNPTGSSLVYSALIGGAAPAGIAVDNLGNAYVAGSAGSFSPVTPGALDQPCDTGALLLKLDAAGDKLLTAAHLCPDSLWPVGVAFDSSYDIVFSGYTDSADLPTTVGSFRSSKTSGCCFSNGVLGKVKEDGSALMYLTYFGGKSTDSPNAMAQDKAGNVYMAGFTSSTNLPIKNGIQTTNAGSLDAFLAKFTLPVSQISVSPAVLNFATEGVGEATSASDVTIANLGTSPIAISNIISSGDFALSSDRCGTELPVGAHCILGVSFKPSTDGNRTGTLTLTNGKGVQKVSLSGAGVSGPFLAFPSAYQINTAAGVISPPFPVTIANNGTAILNISQISLTNGPGFNFVGSTNCLKPVAPQATCTIDVTFSGSYSGQSYAILSFTDNAPGSPQSFGLAGNVIGSGLVLTSTGMRFGEQSVGTTSSAQQVTLLNGTASALTIGSIKTVGNFSQSHTCGSTLAAGAYCYIKATFKPTSTGIKQGSLVVSSSASGSPQALPLLGTGN